MYTISFAGPMWTSWEYRRLLHSPAVGAEVVAVTGWQIDRARWHALTAHLVNDYIVAGAEQDLPLPETGIT
jgi:hypothetical protein